MWNVDEIDPSYRCNEEGILLLKFTDPPPNARGGGGGGVKNCVKSFIDDL